MELYPLHDTSLVSRGYPKIILFWMGISNVRVEWHCFSASVQSFERLGLTSSGLADMWKKVGPVIQEVRRRTIKQVSTVIRIS